MPEMPRHGETSGMTSVVLSHERSLRGYEQECCSLEKATVCTKTSADSVVRKRCVLQRNCGWCDVIRGITHAILSFTETLFQSCVSDEGVNGD